MFWKWKIKESEKFAKVLRKLQKLQNYARRLKFSHVPGCQAPGKTLASGRRFWRFLCFSVFLRLGLRPGRCEREKLWICLIKFNIWNLKIKKNMKSIKNCKNQLFSEKIRIKKILIKIQKNSEKMQNP